MSTDGWIDVCQEAELPDGEVRVVELADGRPVAVFHAGDAYYAIEDRCSHEDETLSWGVVEGCEVTCPRHGAKFSLATGAALSPPAYEPVPVFAVRLQDGVVQVASAPSGKAGR